VDGFCVGEPWNSLAVAEGLGRIVVTKSQLLPRGAEKVLALRADFEAQTERLGPLLRALAEAARWADAPENRPRLAALLARPELVGAPAELIERALGGRLALGGGRETIDPEFMYFHRHGANCPRPEEALWAYAQMVRWGQVRASAELEAIAAGVYRADLYGRHVEAVGASAPLPVPFDDVEFTAADVSAYVGRFNLYTRFAETPQAAEL
jgi:NitT/TauT family transport system ATP-binding protein